jgi:hypothetical protein
MTVDDLPSDLRAKLDAAAAVHRLARASCLVDPKSNIPYEVRVVIETPTGNGFSFSAWRITRDSEEMVPVPFNRYEVLND